MATVRTTPFRRVGWFVWEDEAVTRSLALWCPIHMATLHGYHENSVHTVEVLCECEADLDAISPLDGYRAFHLAATEVERYLRHRMEPFGGQAGRGFELVVTPD